MSRTLLELSTLSPGNAVLPGSVFPRSRKDSQWPPLKYAQCWEDADVLLEAMNVHSSDICLSIASGGENTLALLACSPKKVIAVDLNPTQLCCLQLKASAFRNLSHEELLALLGSRTASASERQSLYRKVRADLDPTCSRYFDKHPDIIGRGINSQGKFEGYLALFRQFVLPLVHDAKTIEELFGERTAEKRRRFYSNVWNTRLWRLMFQVFFSRYVMGLAGRDPELFSYVEGPVAQRIFKRVKVGLTETDPADNPYLQWILFGKHLSALPFALRKENFQAIRRNLNCLTWHCSTLEDCLDSLSDRSLNACNLSDIFEYMSVHHYEELAAKLCRKAAAGSRLVYWNMLVPRRCSHALRQHLIDLPHLSMPLYAKDKAFFYSDFVVEEVV